MTDADSARTRARGLIELTRRLTDRLTREIKALEARRPQDLAAGLQETQDLVNLYRRECAAVKAAPALLAPAPLEDRRTLAAATQAFEGVLARYAGAVEAARIVSEGLVRTIAQELAVARTPASAYDVAGRAAQGDGRAVAFNGTA